MSFGRAIGLGLILFLGTEIQVAQASKMPCLGQAMDLQKDANIPLVHLQYTFAQNEVTKDGWFLIDTGSNVSSLDISLAEKDSTGNRKSLTELNFFEKIKFPVFLWNDFSGFKSQVKQSGVIGTNLISQQVLGIDLQNRKLYRSDFAHACTEHILANSGFFKLSTLGYFSSNTATDKLFPAEHIHPSLPNPQHLAVPNGPVVPIEVADIKAVAMLDSGYDDRLHPFSVDINAAFLNAINQNKIHLIRAEEIPVGTLATCVKGEKTKTTAFRLKNGDFLNFISEDGKVVKSYSQAIFFLKSVPERAFECGGIGTWEIPAAQIGASFLKSMGITIFNAQKHAVWIKKDPS